MGPLYWRMRSAARSASYPKGNRVLRGGEKLDPQPDWPEARAVRDLLAGFNVSRIRGNHHTSETIGMAAGVGYTGFAQ